MLHGDVCNIESHSHDIGATRSFYEKIFGWTIQDIPGFVSYDIDGTLTWIEEGGGQAIMPTTRIPDQFELYTLFLGDVSNHLGLWST